MTIQILLSNVKSKIFIKYQNFFNFIFLISFSLEGLNGGLNLFINLNLNKELSLQREAGAYVCKETGREFNKVSLMAKGNNVYWPSNFPKTENVKNIIYL